MKTNDQANDFTLGSQEGAQVMATARLQKINRLLGVRKKLPLNP